MAHDPSMIDIKKTAKPRNDVFSSDDDSFPFGTRLHLEDGLVEALGIEALSPGDIVEVKGFAVVKSKSEHSDTEGSTKDMSLQMTFIKVKREDDDRVEQLYGG